MRFSVVSVPGKRPRTAERCIGWTGDFRRNQDCGSEAAARRVADTVRVATLRDTPLRSVPQCEVVGSESPK